MVEPNSFQTPLPQEDDSEEAWREWARRRPSWDVWEWDVFLGRVGWTGEDLLVYGPYAGRLNRILDSMGRGMTRKELWGLLPDRLTGHIFLSAPPPFGGT